MEKENQNKKILVVGSKGHPREVQCYDWAEMENMPNVADYDAVIIDMTTLGESILEELSRKGVRYFTEDYFSKLFSSEGKVFVIAMFPIIAKNLGNSYWWNPLRIDFRKEGGNTIENISPEFQRYFNNVKNWQFTINSSLSNPLYVTPLAQNRYKEALGISIIVDQRGFGTFYFLPPTTEVSSNVAIDIILEDFFQIKISETPEPDWVKEIKVPQEEEIQEEIQERLYKIENENKEIDKLEKQKGEIIKFRKLLYTEGEELQQIVWTTFRELGATVIEPKERNQEDGWIETKFGKGVLEIKKDKKSASRSDTRQLDNWVANCIARSEKCKGILVINHYGDKPLKERKEPFPSDVIQHAKEARPGNPFCLLTTVEFFNAFCAFKRNEITPDEILKKIFEAVGEECKLK